MQIVIDVDTDNPIHHAEGTDYFMPDLHAFISENLFKILKESCKVLPKGHGRLIDADQLLKEAHDIVVPVYPDGHEYRHYCVCVHSIYEAPTIIKADKEDYIPTITEVRTIINTYKEDQNDI